MRPVLVVFILMSATLAGCFTQDAPRTTSLFGQRPVFGGLTGDDVVTLSIAVVDRDVGDRTLDQDLWKFADEQALDSDLHALLQRNGLRVGCIVGEPPPELQSLIDTSRKGSATPQRIQSRAGIATPVAIGPVRAQCRFQLDQDGKKTPVDLARSLCQFRVLPKLAEDGRVLLSITPFIQHGDPKYVPTVDHLADGERQWDMKLKRDEESYPSLTVELPLEAKETVVIGTRRDTVDTLGQRFFVDSEASPPVQRLLVLRVSRLPADPVAKAEASRDVPLALQAEFSGSE